MKIVVAMGVVAFGFVPTVVLAQTSGINQHAAGLGSAAQGEMSRVEAHLAAPIRSERDLYLYLTTVSDSPLNRLSAESKWQFIGSLIFPDKGLASYRYDVLKRELTASEIREVLALFGVQHTARLIEQTDARSSNLSSIPAASTFGGPICTTPNDPQCSGDHENYWCTARGTCAQKMQHICTDNC